MPKRMSSRMIRLRQEAAARSSRTPARPRRLYDSIDSLPFSIEDAEEHPERYRYEVTPAVWEQLQQEIMTKMYSTGKAFDCPEETLVKATLLNEQSISDLYFQGVLIARAHRDIRNILLESDYGWAIITEPLWCQEFKAEERANLVLKALDEATHFTVGFGFWSRRYCPDLTVSKLAYENDGFAFIRLLRLICQSAQTFQRQEDYYAIPCQEFNDFYAITHQAQDTSLPPSRTTRTFQTNRQHDRNWFICCFVLAVLKRLEFVKTTFISATLVQKERKPLEMCEAHYIRGESVVANQCPCSVCCEMKKEACASCRRYASEIPNFDRNELFHCQNCLKIDPPYKVSYCSKDCQIRDWNEGGHRARCARRLTDLAFPPLGWSPIPETPPPCLSLQSVYKHPLRLYNFFNADKSPHGSLASPPHHDFCDARATAIGRGYQYDEASQLIDRAIETRKEKDVRAFIISLSQATAKSETFEGQILPQLVADWDFDSEKIKEWYEEGLRRAAVFDDECDYFCRLC